MSELRHQTDTAELEELQAQHAAEVRSTQPSKQQHAKVNSGTCFTGERYMLTLSVIRDPAELEATHVQHAALRHSYSNTDCDGSAPAAAAKPIAYSVSHEPSPAAACTMYCMYYMYCTTP